MMSIDVVARLTKSRNDEVERLAMAMGISPGYALNLRKEWRRKLYHRCVHCNEKLEKGQKVHHPWCSGTVLDKRPVEDLFTDLADGAAFCRPCAECGKEFMISADQVRRAYQFGFLEKLDRCSACRKANGLKKLTFKPFNKLQQEDLRTSGDRRSAC